MGKQDDAENLKKLRQRALSKRQSMSQSEDEDEDEDDEEQEQEQEQDSLEEIEIQEEEKGKIASALKSVLKKIGMGSLLATGGTLGTVGLIATLLIGIYRVHFDGEFEFKGITGEYQNLSFKNMNFSAFSEDGNVQLLGLTKENKLTKTYYNLYADKSYFVIVEDSSKYKDINDAYKRENLLTPDELREKYPDIQDIEGREKMFQLNPDVIYSLDRYLHKNNFLYPQQFVKPVSYEENQQKFSLKQLTNNQGTLIAKSQLFDSNGKPLTDSNGALKQDTGVWDYGFASILRYKEYEIKERVITNMAGIKLKYKGYSNRNDLGDVENANKEVSQSAVGKIDSSYVAPGMEASGTSPEKNTGRYAYAIDTAVTAGGTINSKVAQKWQEKSGSRHTVTKTYPFVETVTKVVPIEGEQGTETHTIEYRYELEYTYEIYEEEYVPYYEGDLDTSSITGSQYFRDYIKNYSNYIPIDIPNKLDFKVFENNEDINELLYDDDPKAFSIGTGTTNNSTSATKEEFEKAIFMGDSITVGLNSSSTVTSDRVFAKSSFTVSQGTKEFADAIIKAKPPVVVISYGTNDAGYKNTEQFKKDYKELITKLKSGIPGVKIYLNKIFPGNIDLAKNNDEKTIIQNISAHNLALEKIASESGVTVIDCTNITNLKSYYSDAVHFKSSFYPLWISEMEKKIVGNTSTADSNTSAKATKSLSILENNTTNDLLRTAISTSNKVGDKPLAEVLQQGKLKDSSKALAGLKWLNIAEKYGKMYGIDPFIICAIIACESNGNPNAVNSYGYSGLMQISRNYIGNKYTAFNHTTNTYDTVSLQGNKILDPDHNIHIGTMMLANNFKDSSNNVYLSIQGHNNGIYGAKFIIMYYLSGGTLTGIPSSVALTKEQTQQFNEYAQTNDVGWITALFKGDLAEERADENGHGFYDPNDGVHDACVWYASKKPGQAYYLREVIQYYAGDGAPWMTKEDGTVVTADGGSASGYGAGSVSANMAFNSYLASNWEKVLELKEQLFPWSTYLDEQLAKESTSDYSNLKNQSLLIRNEKKYFANLKGVDVDIVLNMMFALNQSNYLSKYDYMGEEEWKAMYNQLLSSPTGKTWDDKWIGFTCEDVFGKSLEQLGTLFKKGSGVNPTISRPYGMLMNLVSDDTSFLTQYNEMNFGMDLSLPSGTEVLALEDGEVVSVDKKASNVSRFGNFVVIKYTSKTYVTVANLKEVDKKIKEGGTVKKGQVLGLSGGNCKSFKENDLHIKLSYNGNLINPEWILTRDMTGFDDPISGVTCAGGGNCQTIENITAEGDFVWPVPTHSRISSPFGYRTHPVTGVVNSKHSGIDIPAPTGTNVVAAKSGTVTYSAMKGSYGNLVIIDHGDGTSTYYAHNSALVATKGSTVKQGDVIAKIGSTGRSTGPHLHFEVRVDDVAVNPVDYVTPPSS